MKLVILESPYRGPTPEAVERNINFARRCLRDSLMRGEAPIASHLLHTQVLDDSVSEDRETGIAAGIAWVKKADAMVVYRDLGISQGMRMAIDYAQARGIPVEHRWLSRKTDEAAA